MVQQVRGTGPQTFAKDTSIGGLHLGSFGDGAYYNDANKALPISDEGKYISLYSPDPQAVSLPLISTVPAGATFTIHNPTSAIKTVTINGSDKISPNGSLLTSVLLKQGDVAVFISESGVWRMTGTASLQYLSSFAASKGVSGSQRLPSGIVLQWGMFVATAGASNVAGTGWVNFPFAFPTIATSVFLQQQSVDNVLTSYAAAASPTDAGRFSWAFLSAAGGLTRNVGWLAIGH